MANVFYLLLTSPELSQLLYKTTGSLCPHTAGTKREYSVCVVHVFCISLSRGPTLPPASQPNMSKPSLSTPQVRPGMPFSQPIVNSRPRFIRPDLSLQVSSNSGMVWRQLLICYY